MKHLKNIILGLLMFIFVMSGVACGSTSSTTPSPATSAQPSASASPSSASLNAVTMKNFSFSPAEITIKKGDTVTWTNEDTATHDVAGTSFKSGNMKKGDTFSYTFNETGTFDYVCSFHASMKGTIIVE